MHRHRHTRSHAVLAAAVAAAGSAFALAASSASAQSINLQFSGSGSTLAATGFENVYNLDPTGFTVGGGKLTLQTLPGDTFGNYENDPDSAKNMFYTSVPTPPTRTVVEAKVTVSDLNVNFHGGGIWFGTDQDHYVRLGIINNSFEGGVDVEGLRENQDLWPGNTPPGPGNDIQGVHHGLGITTPQDQPLDVILRLIRDGSGATMFYSIDNGATFVRHPAPGFTFDNVVTGPGQGANGGPSIEGGFKVGLYAFGGPDGQIPATFAYDYFTASGGVDEWNLTGSGTYDNDSSWTLLTPSGVEATALFGSKITAASTVTINNEHNIGTVTFNNANSYTIAGPGTLTFNSFVGPAGINVVSGSHTISSNVNFAKSTVFTVTPAASSLTVTNGLVGVGSLTTLSKEGAGSLIVKNVRVDAGLAINGGTVTVMADGTSAGTSRIGTLSIAGGTTPTATLDLNNNDLVTSTAKATVEAQVKSARAGGTWPGKGITSSSARNVSTTGLGVLSGAEFSSVGGNGTFSGQTYAAGDTLVKYTWNGDANLDGRVTFDDYVKIDTGFNTALTGWLNGDFNYSGNVSFDDYVLIDIAFNQQNGTLGRAIDWISGDDRSTAGLDQAGLGEVLGHLDQFGTAYGAAFLAAVPEPTSLALLGVPALAGMIRRRRSVR